MRITLGSASDIGPLVRATSKSLGLRQDDTAGTIGVSENFLRKVERGDDSVQWSKLFKVLDHVGIRLTTEIPASQTPARGRDEKARDAPE
ncbi:MAG: transcriptional regulator [Pseudomonadota bacterium]